MESYSLLFSSSQGAGLLSGFQRLRSDRRMCDVVLETGGVSFPCHRALLASSSEYFWALFGESTAERLAPTVSLPALTPRGLDIILDFLYSGWLSLSPLTLPIVLETARYLQVHEAVSICDRFLNDGLSLNTCCCYANLAECHALPEALAASNQTITMEMAALLQDKREDLLELNIQSLTAVLEAEEIPGVKEAELVRLALDWLEVNGPLPLVRSNLLLSRLRFGLVTPSDLAILSHAHPAMATPLMRSHVTRALEYHGQGAARPIRQSRQTTLRSSANHVLLVGGGVNPDSPDQEVLTFDLKNRKWSSLAPNLPRLLKNHCVCCVGGFLFVIGGEEVVGGTEEGGKTLTTTTTNQVWRYDPRFACWEEVESMLETRAQFTCCVVDDVIYTIGGQHPRADTHTSTASVEFYNMTAGVWRRATPLPRPLYGHASAVLGQALFVSGGIPGHQGCHQGGSRGDQRGSSKELLFLDLGVGGKTWETRAPMSIARFRHHMATVAGSIYALLGMYEPFCDIERYDSLADHWTRLRPLLIGSFSYGLAVTASGTLLLFGGRKWMDGQEVTVKSVLEYDREKDRWKEICQLPRPLCGSECTLLALPN
ncbi:kelch-like protein 34 [Osmerus mordax]|uniref:kelch-like protein 34 n=1 Tax=Osmerus mordax TaxID=8014 RepID=UPI00350FF5E5